ncbi:MAG: hypothetical protein ACYCZX_01550 [Rhodospirillaceae bacterium]
MKAKLSLTSATLALCAFGLLAPVLAAESQTSRTISVQSNPGGPPTTIVEDLTMPNRDVTSLANKYQEGDSVAVIGRVSAKDATSIILDRKDGQVRALIGDPGDDRVAVGDVITVYGQLKREPMDILQVDTEAVKDQTSGNTYLTMRGHERTMEMSRAGQTAKLNYHPL